VIRLLQSFDIKNNNDGKPFNPIKEQISFTDQFLTRSSVFLSCRSEIVFSGLLYSGSIVKTKKQ